MGAGVSCAVDPITQSFMKNLTLLFLAVTWGSALTSCSVSSNRNPVPADLVSKVTIEGVPEARFWGDEWPQWSVERFNNFSDKDFRENFSGIYGKPHNYLAISGGGSNGAYGAGLLAGWSAAGTRPEFTMVTGISTGALSAPFAFLGEKYDARLKELYTTTSTKDVLKKRNLVSALLSDSMASTEPLKRLLEQCITEDMLKEIGDEHRKGRRLFVGTINLDAGRSVIWNIGAIALGEHPNKIQLVREILRASASIPVAFPPVSIPVMHEGEKFDELHADGGTGSQVFVYPASIDWKKLTTTLKAQGRPQVYVIRNAVLEANYQGIKQKVLPIAGRTIASLIRTQGIGDLYQIYSLCKRDGNDFNLGYIPADFEPEPTEDFDPVYMEKLYDFGFEKARNSYLWEHAPPGFLRQ